MFFSRLARSWNTVHSFLPGSAQSSRNGLRRIIILSQLSWAHDNGCVIALYHVALPHTVMRLVPVPGFCLLVPGRPHFPLASCRVFKMAAVHATTQETERQKSGFLASGLSWITSQMFHRVHWTWIFNFLRRWRSLSEQYCTFPWNWSGGCDVQTQCDTGIREGTFFIGVGWPGAFWVYCLF